MTAPPPTPPPEKLPPSPPPVPPNGGARVTPRVKAILVMVAMLVVGFIGGVAGDRAYRRNMMWLWIDRQPGPAFLPGIPLHPPGTVSIRGGGRAGQRPVVVERFMRELDLTPTQSRQMDTIMLQDFAAVRSLREAMQPKVDSVVALTRQRIDSVLTPEQRVRYHELLDRHRAGLHWTQPVEPPSAPPPPPQ
jgi:Spy/CpxP family protein refolding chaperone